MTAIHYNTAIGNYSTRIIEHETKNAISVKFYTNSETFKMNFVVVERTEPEIQYVILDVDIETPEGICITGSDIMMAYAVITEAQKWTFPQAMKDHFGRKGMKNEIAKA